MGINDEYSRDAYNYDLAYDSDDGYESPDLLDPEDWQDWYSEELLDAWTRIKEYQDTNYIKINSKYPKFVEFIISQNKISLIDSPTRTEETMWGLVSNIPVIYNNVYDNQFYHWLRQNIDRYSNV
jgi:hypothetical protein